ncbi:MAG: hypothetical protein AVDCRST_MAG47-1912, partial [uncultured Nocardioidaceae bacterium]
WQRRCAHRYSGRVRPDPTRGAVLWTGTLVLPGLWPRSHAVGPGTAHPCGPAT